MTPPLEKGATQGLPLRGTYFYSFYGGLFPSPASALLDGWNRYYPRDVFPALWQKIEGMINDQHIVATEEVLFELAKKADDIHKWAKKLDGFFVPIDNPIQVEVTSLLSKYPNLLKALQGRSGADPFVIALAKVNNLKIVSGEQRSGSMNKPKIPDVANAENLECLSLMDFIREQGWTF